MFPPETAAPLNGTASFVSDRGLILTNHHAGAAGGDTGAAVVNATVVNAGATAHIQTSDARAPVEDGEAHSRNVLTAQVIRGDPSSGDKS